MSSWDAGRRISKLEMLRRFASLSMTFYFFATKLTEGREKYFIFFSALLGVLCGYASSLTQKLRDCRVAVLLAMTPVYGRVSVPSRYDNLHYEMIIISGAHGEAPLHTIHDSSRPLAYCLLRTFLLLLFCWVEASPF